MTTRPRVCRTTVPSKPSFRFMVDVTRPARGPDSRPSRRGHQDASRPDGHGDDFAIAGRHHHATGDIPQLVAVLETRDSAAETLKSLAPELVVFGLLPGEGPSLAAEVHVAWPQADFLAVAHDSRSPSLHTQDGQREVLADLSPESLVAAMHGRSGRRAGI